MPRQRIRLTKKSNNPRDTPKEKNKVFPDVEKQRINPVKCDKFRKKPKKVT